MSRDRITAFQAALGRRLTSAAPQRPGDLGRSPDRLGSGARFPTIETERIEWRPGESAEPLVVIALAELFAAL